jgi:SAM-dependent methyltransferase
MVKRIINFIKWCLFEQPTLGRMTLERSFKREVSELRQGKILEIGAGDYNSHIEYLKGDYHYFSLNILLSEGPAIVGDACLLPLQDNSINNIIMLEVIEHIPIPDLVIRECVRVLKRGGIMIGSTRFIYPQHGAPCDYYRFTEASIKMLLGAFSECKIEKLGNRLHVLIDIITENYHFLRLFNRLLQYIKVKPSTCYSGLLFIAKK